MPFTEAQLASYVSTQRPPSRSTPLVGSASVSPSSATVVAGSRPPLSAKTIMKRPKQGLMQFVHFGSQKVKSCAGTMALVGSASVSASSATAFAGAIGDLNASTCPFGRCVLASCAPRQQLRRGDAKFADDADADATMPAARTYVQLEEGVSTRELNAAILIQRTHRSPAGRRWRAAFNAFSTLPWLVKLARAGLPVEKLTGERKDDYGAIHGLATTILFQLGFNDLKNQPIPHDYLLYFCALLGGMGKQAGVDAVKFVQSLLMPVLAGASTTLDSAKQKGADQRNYKVCFNKGAQLGATDSLDVRLMSKEEILDLLDKPVLAYAQPKQCNEEIASWTHNKAAVKRVSDCLQLQQSDERFFLQFNGDDELVRLVFPFIT